MTADPRLVVVVPTRSRPHNIPPLIEAMEATRSHVQTRAAIVIDDSHPGDYLCGRFGGGTVDACRYLVGFTDRHRGMCGTLNTVSKQVVGSPKPTIVGFMGDDHRPRTVGWDQAIIDAMPPLGVVYCDDGFQGPNLPTSVFMDAELIRRLGWMVPPGIGHLFCDNAWKAIGEALGTLVYLPDVLIEHMHPHAAKAPTDAQYEAVNSARQWEADEAAYRRWLVVDMSRDIARARGEGQ